MKSVKSFLLLFLLLLVFINTQAQRLEFVQGEFIVQFTSDESARQFQQNIAQTRQSKGIQKMTLLCDSPWKIYTINIDYISVDENLFLQKLRDDKSIVVAQRNRKGVLRNIPNDPLFSSQWQYINNGLSGGVVDADLDIEEAWDITTGGVTATGDSIVVAVIDDGYAVNHPDLKGNLWTNHNEVAGDSIDNDENGYIDDAHGWNFDPDFDPTVPDIGLSHGSSVAGIIGAQGNNEIGVSGVNWRVKILPIVYRNISEASVLQCYSYVFKMRKLYNESNGQKGAFIVASNSSWGIDRGQPESAPLWCAMYDSLGKVGVLNCGATTNNNFDVDVEGDLPTACASEFLMSVTNINRSDKKVQNAGYGKTTIDLGAFGSEVYTTNRNSYGSFGGTSGATPHVAGTIALMYAVPCNYLINLAKQSPDVAALLVKDLILNHVDSIPTLIGITTSEGRLNTGKSVKAANSLCTTCATTTSHMVDVDEIGKITFTWIADAGITVIIRYRLNDGDPWQSVESSTNEVTIDSVQNCRQYVYQVATICNDSLSSFSYKRYFTSGGCCDAIKDVKLIPLGNGATIINNEYANLESTLLHYRMKGELAWDSLRFNDTVTLTNLPDCSIFEYTLTRECNTFGGKSIATPIALFSTQCGNCTSASYCKPPSIDNTQEWIASVKLGDLENNSMADPNGYGAYLGGDVPTLKQAESYPLSIAPGYAGSMFNEYFTVFIDYNQDNVFDAEENVLNLEKSTNMQIDTSITIAANALIGYTRMRVMMNYDTSKVVCEGFRYGEVEDYCIEIVKGGLSVNEESDVNITVYPNPVSENLYVEGSKIAFIEIVDLQGRSLMKLPKSSSIDLKQLPEGIYFCVITTNDGKVTCKKIIKI